MGTPPAMRNGYPVASRLPAIVQKRVRAMLEAGTRHLTQVAKSCGVTTDAVKRLVESDPELKALHDAAYEEKMEEVEEAAFDICTDPEINPIARVKMIETMLKGRRSKIYNQSMSDPTQGGPAQAKRIIIAPVLPVVQVDANGVPLSEKRGHQEEVIDV